jgi:hypothetical protein
MIVEQLGKYAKGERKNKKRGDRVQYVGISIERGK